MAVSRKGCPQDVIINLDTLKRMGVVDKDFPKINDEQFEMDVTKLEDLDEVKEYDQYGFSNRYV